MVKINGINEDVLVERLLNSDQTAFELIFGYYYRGLVVFAKQIVQNEEEAEEIVQDFFVQLWSGRKNIRQSDSLKNYFFVSVKNRALNYLKKEQVREKVIGELKQLIETDLLYQPDLFVDSEFQNQIKKAFSQLPPRTNEIFKLSRLNGFSNEEIATQLSLSKRTVETQISNALKIMRKELGDYHFLLLLF